MIVLGIDPGTRTIGYGLVKKHGAKIEYIDYGIISTNPKKTRADNLVELGAKLTNLLEKYKPQLAGIEKIFFAKNVKTVIGVSEARGVILLTIKQHNIPIFECTPLEVKQSVTGDGAADKKQVQKMIKIVLALEEEPKPDDAADALAIAICCAQQSLN